MNGMLARVSKKVRKNPNSSRDENRLELDELYATYSTNIIIEDEKMFDGIKVGDIIFVERKPLFKNRFYCGDSPTLLCLIKDLEKLI